MTTDIARGFTFMHDHLLEPTDGLGRRRKARMVVTKVTKSVVHFKRGDTLPGAGPVLCMGRYSFEERFTKRGVAA